MCGFLGEFSFVNNNSTDGEDFRALLELSKHRGPDSTEVIKNANYQLGFNRLAILDLSANANQPKYSPSKRYAVVFNGEIYNYKTLQKEHQLENLKSTSDTEILIHLLDKFGIEETVRMLNGMFAIALVDNKHKTLSLARDFAGIKPLFYGVSNTGIVCASQFNQIFKHPWHRHALHLRPEIMKEYFGFGYMRAPNTLYDHIFQVEPGELIQFSSKGEFTKKNYLKFSKFNSDNEKGKSEKTYNTVLKEAVSNQLLSDVPLASFLSGGIDSPLITAIAKEVNPNIEAFTFGVDLEHFDESKKAISYAKHLNIKHTLDEVNENEIVLHIDEHFKYFSEPFGDFSSIPTYLVTKKARQSHTVMLSGDGGDELFFGYPRLLDISKKRHWFKIPFVIRKPLIKTLNRLNVINTWAPYFYSNIGEWIKAKHLYILPSELDRFFNAEHFSEETEALFKLSKTRSKSQLLHWLRWNEFYGHMQRVLTKVDRASMANSLEVRVPFLDKGSINYYWEYLPLQFKDSNDLKNVLKENLGMYYPKDIIQTEKKGFSVPIVKWLIQDLQEEVEDYIFKKPFYGEHFINTQVVKKFVRDFYDRKHNNGWGVWHIYAWQKWAYTHLIN